MPQNNGKPAERAFVERWAHGHVERLRDRADLIGLNKNSKIADFAKPSDFLVSSHDVPLHYAEVKSTHKEIFSFGDIRDAQHVAAIREAHRGHGDYRFYIFSYARSQWYVMTCHRYAELIDSGRRSVKFEELTPW